MTRKRRMLSLNRLEERCVPAVFGQPWTDARHLSLSFVPDGTLVGSTPSSLFSTLNAQQSTIEWQSVILRAVQTWASVANIDVAVVPDNGSPIGSNVVAGAPRTFGELRIAAIPLTPSALAIAVPPDPFFAESWAGDVIYNSANKLNPAQTDLYSVMLHELGHGLGLDSNMAPTSAMYNNATTPRTGISSADVVNLQAMYGTRAPDLNEGSNGNDSSSKATRIHYSDTPGDAFHGQFPLAMFGDISTGSDIDVFELRNLDNYSGPLTFHLQSKGVSLLAPKLTVTKSSGSLLGTSLSTDPAGDIVTVHLNQSTPGATYYVRIEGATDDAFGIGRYGMAVTFDTENNISAARLNEVLRGPFELIDPKDLQDVFENPNFSLLGDDEGDDDVFANAGSLGDSEGYAANTRFETVGSLATATDIDVYRIRTPAGSGTRVLTITTSAQPVNGGTPLIEVYTSNQQLVPSTVLANSDGRLRIQVTGLATNDDYFVRLRGTSPSQLGNYNLTVMVGVKVAALTQFTSGSLIQPRSEMLIVNQNQVFSFLLTNNGPLGSILRMRIRNTLGVVQQEITAARGATVSGRPLLLRPGSYSVTFDNIGTAGLTIPFTLRGSVLSDPIGPLLNDPTVAPAGPGWRWKRYDSAIQAAIEIARGIEALL